MRMMMMTYVRLHLPWSGEDEHQGGLIDRFESTVAPPTTNTT